MDYGLWKGISSNMDDFFSLVKFKVNKSDRVWFWIDVWFSREPPCTLFPTCFRLASSKYGLVQDHMICSRIFCS